MDGYGKADGLNTKENFFTNYKPMYSNQQPNESDDSQPSAEQLKSLHNQKLPTSLQQLKEQACLYALGGAIHFGIPPEGAQAYRE